MNVFVHLHITCISVLILSWVKVELSGIQRSVKVSITTKETSPYSTRYTGPYDSPPQ